MSKKNKKSKPKATTPVDADVQRGFSDTFPTPDPKAGKVFSWDDPYAFITPQSPKRKPFFKLDTYTMRNFAEVYDPLRSCINHLKAELAAVRVEVVAKDQDDDAPETKARIEEAQAWLGDMESGMGGFGKRRSHFESEILEDHLIIGAAAIHFQKTRGGNIRQVVAIDASTICPVVDVYGNEGEKPYQQWIQGVPVASFDAGELIYDGIHARSYTPFFGSPVEWLLAPIKSALAADDWNRTWLTEGNTPADMVSLPTEWTVDQIKLYAQFWDGMMKGDVSNRTKTKFVPGGSSRVGSNTRKDQEFSVLETWLLKRCCSMFGVQPASIGYGDLQYKTSQKNSTDITSMYGAGTLLEWRRDIYNEILKRCGYGDLEVRNVAPWEEDQGQQADRLQKATGRPWLTVNEARKVQGYNPIEGGDVLFDASADPKKADSVDDEPENVSDGQEEQDDLPETQRSALTQWMRKALKRAKERGTGAVGFVSEDIPEDLSKSISRDLSLCVTPADVRRVFQPILGAE